MSPPSNHWFVVYQPTNWLAPSVFEIPSNIILKKLKPHLWLSICMFMFGLTTILQGLVQNYHGLLATRFFLGVFEAGMYPPPFPPFPPAGHVGIGLILMPTNAQACSPAASTSSQCGTNAKKRKNGTPSSSARPRWPARSGAC